MYRSRWLALLAILVLMLAACGDDGGGAETESQAEPDTEVAAPAEGECEEGATVETDSGLSYEDVECGTGEAASRGDTVTVKYRGSLEDGKEFDAGTLPPFQIGANDLIAGFDEGVVGMQPGGKRTVTIPPELGYGPQGYPPVIPPNATLIFDLELVELKSK